MKIKRPIPMTAAVILAIVAAGCPSGPPSSAGTTSTSPPPPPDRCELACTRLAAIGCAEGADHHCAGVCRNVIDSGITTRIDFQCAASAATKEAARSCAGITCP